MAEGPWRTGSSHAAGHVQEGVVAGGVPVGGGQTATHRGSDLAAQGPLRPGEAPGQDARRLVEPPGGQGGGLHLWAVAQRRTWPAAAPSCRPLDLSNYTATV